MSIKTICYLSFGYPTIEKSIEMAGRYIEGGCDAIEVSIPPKDPYRDSAFLQELYRVALAQTDDYSKYLEGIGRMTEQYPSTEFFLCFIMRSLWQSARRSWASSARSTTSSTSFPATCMTPRQLRHCGSMVSSWRAR